MSSWQLSVLEGSLELQDHFVVAHGMLAVLEVLETKPSRDVTLNLLGIVNMVRSVMRMTATGTLLKSLL